MTDTMLEAELHRRRRATLVVGTMLFLLILAYLAQALVLLQEGPFAAMLGALAALVGAMLVLARRGRIRVAAWAFSLLAVMGVLGGVVVRGNPGYAPFYMLVGVVIGAVTLAPRDVGALLVIALGAEALVASWPSSEKVDTISDLYTAGLMLLLIVGLMALATSWSVARLVAELARREAEVADSKARSDRLAQQLQQSQRMEALGRLAGGIAHDFNNLLGLMAPCVHLVGAALPATSPAQVDLRQLGSAIELGASLTRQLLAFSRRDLVEVTQVDLRDVVEGTGDLLRRLAGNGVAVSIALDPTPCPLRAAPSQLEQVLMNLAVNARDAMAGKGSLSMSVQRRDDPALGAVACLTATDDGPGMSEEVRLRLFEPFFTTKSHAQGTGLGLATVYGIVTALGGRVEVESTLGKGSTFRVMLPLAPMPQQVESPPSPQPVRRAVDVI